MNKQNLNTLSRAVKILSKTDKQKVLIVTVLQVLLSGLDLLGIIAIGLLGTLTINIIQGIQSSGETLTFLKYFGLGGGSLQHQALLLGMFALILLVGRTILSIIFTRRILFFLSRRGAMISAELIRKLLSQPLLKIQSRSSQETVYAVTIGVERIVLQVIATSTVWVADLALLIVIVIGLLIINPITAISSILVFSIVGYILYLFMHTRALNFGVKNAALSIKSSEKIVEVLASYREAVVRNRRDYYSNQIGELRYALANTSAELGFLPYVSKYVIETTVVAGTVLIGVIQFLLQESSQALATTAIFLAAGTRIAPAVMRLQQGTMTIRSGLGISAPTLELYEELKYFEKLEKVSDFVDLKHEGFEPKIEIRDVCLTYPGKVAKSIANINITVPAGSSVAIVGPSGAGKTTLIDILLGVLNPDSGTVEISGVSPLEAISKWPGAISYVPQDVVIADGTIKDNIGLGYPNREVDEELIYESLKIAQLDEFVSNLPEGINTQVGERGAKISGGQRQRLGIARAMFTKPKILVLDEATSSLDAETEASISKAIELLRGKTTVVLVAHRLSTIRNADQVVYLSEGHILATGTFQEVREAIPNFDQQAKIMGL